MKKTIYLVTILALVITAACGVRYADSTTPEAPTKLPVPRETQPPDETPQPTEETVTVTTEPIAQPETPIIVPELPKTDGARRILYLGNSLVEGIRDNSDAGWTDEEFICKTGISLHSFLSKYEDELESAKPTIVVCEFGTNEANYVSKEGFLDDYRTLISMFPYSVIYIMEIPPAATSNNIDKMNGWLQELEGCTYLPVDTTGFVYASDGVHITYPSYYIWHKAIREAILDTTED